MPYSMTGFAYVSKTFDSFEISIKFKSVNNKSIDISIKSNNRDILFFVESKIRNIIKDFFSRGSFQAFINIKQTDISLDIPEEPLKKAVDSIKNITKYAGLSLSDDKIYDIAYNLIDGLDENLPDDSLKEAIIDTFKTACGLLMEERKKEGEILIKDIIQRLDKIKNLVNEIEKEKDEIISKEKNKVIKKLQELLGENHLERVFIEATVLADKMDITEEIVRLKTHIQRFLELTKKQEPVGRKMDFLCQEMHREINTLGNKMPQFSDINIEIKTEIEKIRQQVQNIE